MSLPSNRAVNRNRRPRRLIMILASSICRGVVGGGGWGVEGGGEQNWVWRRMCGLVSLEP